MKTGNQPERKGRLSPFICCVAVAFAAIISQPLNVEAAPLLLSHFKLNGDGQDALGNSPPMDLAGVSFTNDTLALPQTGFFSASARITGFSYTSFTVAFDFRPSSFDLPHRTLLSGGPLYRWLGFENDASGHLLLRLNNGKLSYSFTNAMAINQWHTLVCSVDLPSQTIVTVLDQERLPDIALQNFQFEVIGTSFEESDKAFSFWNSRNSERFCGQADNLRVYSRALTGQQLQTHLSPRLSVQRVGPNALIHWAADLTGFVPEWAASLTPPIRWLTDNRSAVIVGDQRVLIDAPASGTRFYRLRRF